MHKFLSGPLGGDAQIGSLLVSGGLDLVVFLVDPLTAHPHEPDVQSLARLANVHNVPIASNEATAKLLLKALLCECQK